QDHSRNVETETEARGAPPLNRWSLCEPLKDVVERAGPDPRSPIPHRKLGLPIVPT
ncbi:MAG: hypothetical protein QOF73_43, partial [Thermomicrobiales bacterium]|nr:hypothetical protein [Thermomicrobiales bacterium]